MDELIEHIAQAAHEANRVYCQSIGDNTQLEWDEAPPWQRLSARNGVRFHLEHPEADASASHQSWYDEKLAAGWSYGPAKDVENKRHPCMVPFSELPIEQQVKDHIFRSIVHSQDHIYRDNYCGTL